jgi:quinol monooxygenase YgiN
MMPKLNFCRLSFITAVSVALSTSCKPLAESKPQLVRLAVIEVDTTQINSYNEFLREEIDASILKEPGVITLYGVAERENPERVTLFETYADSAQYKAHLATPHFQKYKQGTLQMVTHLELIETQPILYHLKNELSKTPDEDLFIRLIKMEIDSAYLHDFTNLATDVMLPGLRNENGMLVMYAVAEKLKPTSVTILEVYANEKAYEEHRQTPHFLKYKDESARMVRSLKLIDAKPILLGSKPQ